MKKFYAKKDVQRGASTVLIAISLFALIGFTALGIDIGYLFVVKNEMQNAADAAALAGASNLYKDNTPPTPNWALAEEEAEKSIALNKAANTNLSDGTISSGYWDITREKSALQAKTITPTNNDYPAIEVRISKAEGENEGEVSTFFARALGIDTAAVGAKAVAVIISPGYKTSLFPIAITQCLFNNFWDSETDTPKPTPTGSYDIIIGSSYHYDACGTAAVAGQWTSLGLDANDVTTTRKLIQQATGELSPTDSYYDHNEYRIGDHVWIEPGTKTAIYSDVNACSANGTGSEKGKCEYVIVPVVQTPAEDYELETHTETPITGFDCIRILRADGGRDKTITIQMVPLGHEKCKTSGGGIGPSYGAYLPPRLAM